MPRRLAITFLQLMTAMGDAEQLPDFKDVFYKPGVTDPTQYERERCLLDVYLPEDREKPAAVMIWFHGGGLTAGSKNGEGPGVAAMLRPVGMVTVVANYRFSPDATFPAYVQDAAAAVAFVRIHAEAYGIDPQRIFIGGHSAGGYLAALLAYDSSYLARHQMTTAELAGVVPISPQVFTHFTVRGERGIEDARTTPVIDDAAPAFHARADAPPTLLIWGGDDLPTRPEEVRYFLAVLREKKHPDCAGLEVPGRTHDTIRRNLDDSANPVRTAIVEFMKTRHSSDDFPRQP